MATFVSVGHLSNGKTGEKRVRVPPGTVLPPAFLTEERRDKLVADGSIVEQGGKMPSGGGSTAGSGQEIDGRVDKSGRVLEGKTKK